MTETEPYIEDVQPAAERDRVRGVQAGREEEGPAGGGERGHVLLLHRPQQEHLCRQQQGKGRFQ